MTTLIDFDMGVRNPIVFFLFASLLVVMIIIYILTATSNQTAISRNKYHSQRSEKTKKEDRLPKGCYDCPEDQSKCHLIGPEVLKQRQCRQILPQFINLGAAKSGTTALGKFLDLHPSLVGSFLKLTPSDVVDIDSNRQDVTDIVTAQMRLSTPTQLSFLTLMNDPDSYAFDVATLDKLTPMLREDIPLIMIFRDPVERAMSEYFYVKQMMLKNPHEVGIEWEGEKRVRYFRSHEVRDTFEATVIDAAGNVRQDNQLVNTGIYINHVSFYLTSFKLRKMLFLDGEVFINDPLPVLREVEEFLRLPHFFESKHFRQVEGHHFRCAYVAQRPDVQCLEHKENVATREEIEPKVVEKLRQFYRPHTIHLQNLIDKRFSWHI